MERSLPGVFGVELVAVSSGICEARLQLRTSFMAPNGFLHAATVIALADTCAGVGCRASLPPAVDGFTTIELKANFTRTARAGDALACVAELAHGGGRTQVWDARVRRESDEKELALFRCTQLLLGQSEARPSA